MIKRNPPKIMALAPDGLEGLGVVIAACRASALGIVDLCSVKKHLWADAFRRISRADECMLWSSCPRHGRAPFVVAKRYGRLPRSRLGPFEVRR